MDLRARYETPVSSGEKIGLRMCHRARPAQVSARWGDQATLELYPNSALDRLFADGCLILISLGLPSKIDHQRHPEAGRLNIEVECRSVGHLRALQISSRGQ
jgi:hypothetical protein